VFLISRDLLAAADLGGLPVRLVGVRLEGLSRASALVRQPTADEGGDEPGPSHRDVGRTDGELRAPSGAGASRAGAQEAVRRDRSTTTIVPADLS
jgi:DNA polymerase-4